MTGIEGRVRSEIATFKIRDRKTKPDGTTVLAIAGHLDIDGAPQLQEALAGLFKDGVRTVELDCSNLLFITSVGVGSLIVAVGDFQGVGGDLVITHLSEELHDIFRMLGLADYVTIR
jgi:anti-sigma B factor antagonist